jgi:hypothetical protein
MNFSRNPGAILLGIYLVLSGLSSLVNLQFTGIEMVLATVAAAAGILFLFGRGWMPSGLGRWLLAVYLLLLGLSALLSFKFDGLGIILNLLAMASGLLVLADR